MKTSTVNTINVVEVSEGVVACLYAFPADEEGIKAAENLFVQMAKEQEHEVGREVVPFFTDEEIQEGVENGNLCTYADDWDLYIVHSS